jgi:hypothetical protein
VVIVICAAICNNEVTICQVAMSERPSAGTIRGLIQTDE